MRAKLTALAATLAVLATATATAAIAGGSGYSPPEVGELSVQVDRERGDAGARKAKRPAILYFQAEPSTVDPAIVGRWVDVRLFAERCDRRVRVIDGGVRPLDTDVYQQGSYIASSHEYHVLIGLDDDAPLEPYQITSHLICAKGVR